METIYNKLVRDKIPKIIENDNKVPITHTLSNDEYISELNKKLVEETNEYLEENNIVELADILEVVYALAKAKGISKNDLEKTREEKALNNGTFKDKVFLEKVIRE